MKRFFFLSLGMLASLIFNGCRTTSYYEDGYSSGETSVGGYYDDSYYGYEPDTYTQVVYVEGRPYRYDNDRRLYHTSGGRRIYMSDAQYARNRQAIAQYRAKAKVTENRRDLEYARNKQKVDAYRQEQEWKQKQARANYDQQRKQYEFQRKLDENRASARQSSNRSNLEQQKREWEYKQKQNEAKNRAAVAKWKYENRSSSSEKKKKKDD